MPNISLPSARAFDTGLAALAAASAGFVAFAMPESLFSNLVETSRLPRFVAAAQPPLGDTARFAAIGAVFLLTFAAVWALMAALGRLPARREAEAEAEPEAQAPRLRRADAHPDAPARRPLLARDLGEPLDLEDFPEAPVVAEEPASAEAEQRPLPAFLVPQESEAEPAASEAEAHRSEPEPDPVPVDFGRTEAEPAPQSEIEAETDVGPPALSELAARLPEAGEESDEPLSQLVNRIEFGLSRKRQALPAAADLPPLTEESQAEQEKVGHRLRSAINDLQKIASTGG